MNAVINIRWARVRGTAAITKEPFVGWILDIHMHQSGVGMKKNH